MKNLINLIIGFTFASIVWGLLWNDMRYQRDVALVTADWCSYKPYSNRCTQGLEKGKIIHWYTYTSFNQSK